LYQRVGGDGGAVAEIRDGGSERGAIWRRAPQRLLDPRGDAARGIIRRRGDLPNVDAAVALVEQADVREGPARIDPHAPARHCGSLAAQYAFGYCALRALMVAVEQFDRHAFRPAQEADAHARPHGGRLARELDALSFEIGGDR